MKSQPGEMYYFYHIFYAQSKVTYLNFRIHFPQYSVLRNNKNNNNRCNLIKCIPVGFTLLDVHLKLSKLVSNVCMMW